MRSAFPLGLLALAACQPPAADSYVERSDIRPATRQASEPLPSPDTQGAVWAEVEGQDRLIYGKPGKAPLFAIACVLDGDQVGLRLTRYSPADRGAKAFMAVIGNGHVARLKVDAVPVGDVTLWQGETSIDNQRLEALTGARGVEATVPGAGTLKLNASNRPGVLIERCRTMQRSILKAKAEAEAERPAAQDPPA